nr:hypothetical protein [Tanacetum cinerariifolium]
MRTRSQSYRRRQQQVPPAVVEPFVLEKLNNNQEPPVATMADNRTMAQLLEAPTEGYEEAIVVPDITANNFEIKHGLLNLVQNKQFFGHDKEDPHAHIRYFNKITSTMKFPGVPSTSVKLMLFPFSLEGATRIWLDKEPPRSILTWDDLAWDRFNDLLRACPHHGFSELHQLDTFYNALNTTNQDSLNFTVGGNFLDKMPRECLKIIESKSRVRQSRSKAVVAKVSTSSSAPTVSSDVAELKDMVIALLLDKKTKLQLPLPDAAYHGPAIPSSFSPKAVNCETEDTKDTVLLTNNGGTEVIHPLVVQNSKPFVAPVSAPMPNQKTSIPFPSRRNDERHREKANDQIEKLYKIFRDLSFEISFTDALTLMPKFASTLKTQMGNKEKLSEMARTPLNENCSAVILNKLPKKLGDPGRFLIPFEFSRVNTCNALADLGASINLMPHSVWKDLSLPTLTSTCMTLELADRSITEPISIAKDVYVTVGKFQFPSDFVVVDFEPDPRVPLILGRSFLKTSHALIDVYQGEITLRVGKEAITLNLDQTSRYTANYDHMTANRIDVIDMAYEEYYQEFLSFSNVTTSGNPSSSFDLIVSTSSSTLTPFGDKVDDSYYDSEGDILLLEEILNSDPSPPLPNQRNYLLEIQKELKICETKTVKSSSDEPPELGLKDLPPHLEYVFLEGDDKLPVIIAKDLKDEEKAALIKSMGEPDALCAKKGAITVVKNDDNDLIPTRLVTRWRVRIDYRKLNEATRKDHFSLPFMDQMLKRLTGNQYYCFLDGFSSYF